MNLEWTTKTPTEPGTYIVAYTGAKSRREETDVIRLDYAKGLNNFGVLGGELTIVQTHQTIEDLFIYWPIGFPEECAPVLWVKIDNPHQLRQTKRDE